MSNHSIEYLNKENYCCYSAHSLTKAYFIFFTKSKAENQLKFQQHSATAQRVRVRTTIKLLCWEKPHFIIAPNMWLLIMSDSSLADYRILAMLQEWVCQYPMRDVDKLTQRLIDKQTVIDQAIDRWWFRPMSWVMARHGHFERERWNCRSGQWRRKSARGGQLRSGFHRVELSSRFTYTYCYCMATLDCCPACRANISMVMCILM